jgi:hypothetical protein
LKNIPTTAFFILATCLLLYSCVPLKEVNLFATTSQKCLEQNSISTYGYREYTFDSCWLYNRSGASLKDFECDDGQAAVFDSLLKNEYAILAAYFAGLAKLADPHTIIDVSPVGGSVKAGTYGSLIITDQESKIAGGIATAATDLLTTHYKSGKLKEIILRYNDSIGLAMESLRLHLDNFRGKFRLMRIELERRCDLLIARSGTEDEKWMVAYIYKEKSKAWTAFLASLDARYDALVKIQKGHAEMAKKVEDLHSESLKKTVLDLAGDISDLSNKSKN